MDDDLEGDGATIDADEGLIGGEPSANKMASMLAGTAPPPPPPLRPRLFLRPLPTTWAAAEQESEVFCVRFSPDSQLVAAGLGNGQVKLYQAQSGRPAYQFSTSDRSLPATAMRFRPAGESIKTRNVLLTANADGHIQHWHVTSGKCLHTIVEADNQAFAIDYTADAAKFATAGKDYCVRVYDEATKTKIGDLASGYGKKHAGALPRRVAG
jgi:WD40 repeat protein